MRAVGERERNGGGLGTITRLAQPVKQLHGLHGIGAGDIQVAQRAQGAGVVNERKRAVADGLCPLERRGQAVEVVDLALREFRQHFEPPKALELPPEVIAQVPEQMLGVAACLLSRGARLLGHPLGAVRPLTAEVSQYRCAERRDRQYRAGTRNLPRPCRCAPRGELARALLGEQPLGGFARLALVALIAT